MGKKGKKPYKSSKRTKSQKSLKDWGDQDWRTKSGKKSSKTGERYLPAKAIKALTDEEYKKTSAKKRKDMKKGKQFSDQPKSIAKKVKKYRAESNDDMQYLLNEIKRTWHSNYNQITEYVEHTMAGDGLIAYWDMFDLPNGEQIDENTTKEEYFEKMFQSFYERFAANAQVSTDERGLEVVGHRILYVPVGTKINTESLGNWENRKSDRYGVFNNPITSWLWSDDIYTGVIFGDDSIDHMEGIEGKDFDRIVLAAWIGWEAVDWATTIAFNISGFWQECELCVFDKETVYDLDIYRNGNEEAILEKAMNADSESKKPSSVEISRSTNPEKKLMAVFYDDEGKKMKTTHFGQRGASDYTKHGDKERMERYLERHGGGFETSTKEDWKDPTTAGSLSRWILWNKPSLKGSFDDYKRRFGLKGSINVSKSAESEEKKKYVLKNPDDYFAMLKEIKANPVPIDWKVKMLEKSFPHTGKTWKRGGQYPEVVVAPNFMTIKMNRQFTDYAFKNRGRGVSQHYDLPPHVQGRSKDGLRVYVGSEYDKGYEGRGVHFIDPAKDILHPILKDRKGEVIETLYLDKNGKIELFTGNTPKDKEIIVPDSLQKIMDDIGATEVIKYMKGRSRLWLSPKIPLKNLREGMVLKLNVSDYTGDGLGKIVKIEPKGEDGGIRYYDITFDRMIDKEWVKDMGFKYQREQIKGLHLGKDRDKIATIFANIDPKDRQQYIENSRFQTKEYDERKFFTPQIEYDEQIDEYFITGTNYHLSKE